MDARGQDGLVDRLLDGRYDVAARVARGGMATVYRAHDRRLDREVALKVMHPHLADDPTFVSRFVSEARSAARLSHPNVVQVFDQGEDGEVLYLAMEYLSGRTLRDVITERRVLTPREALSVIDPVLSALSAAHRAGIVHRDVKPENVVLTDDGRVKVADFGLARAMSGGPTQTGSIIGTVAYLAPELVMHGMADARSDVYAAGIMLFEMLTGRQPFVGETPMQIAYRHVHEDVPPPSGLVTELPGPMDDVVAAGTAREPDDRPADAGAYLRLVQQAQAALSPSQLDHRPVVPGAAPTANGDGGFGRVAPSATQVLPSVTEGNLTQTMPEVSALRTARARAGRDDAEAIRAARSRTPMAAELTELTRRRRRSGTVILVSLLAVTAILAGLAWRFLGPGADATAPQLSNHTAAEANTLLAQEQLIGAAQPGGDYTDAVNKGLISRTDPAAGQRLRKGGTVKYWVSLGTAKRTVPKLPGTTLDQAKQLLTAAQLSLGATSSDYSPDIARNSVISSTPAAGAPVKAGDRIVVVVSKGGRPLTLPDVTGKDVNEASQILTDAGFTVDASQQKYDDKQAGQVLSQTPGANDQQPEGSTISLLISKGPEMITLPDVTGRQIRQARRILEALGLQVQENDLAGGFFGTVRFEDPGAGTPVPRGSTVTLTVV